MNADQKLEALLASIPIPKHKQREIKALFEEAKKPVRAKRAISGKKQKEVQSNKATKPSS